MKTKLLLKLKSISSLALLLVMVILSTMSCKKDVDEPILPPTPLTPLTIEHKDIFENQPLKMFSAYEIANNLDFPGHIVNQLGNGLKGGTFGTVVKIGKGLLKFTKWADPNDSTDFEKYVAAINQIEGQLTTLQKSMDALGTQLDMDVTQMKQLIEQGEMNTYITNIQSVMDSSTHTGFGYFMIEGRKFQAGIIDTNQMNIDTEYATAFANNVSIKLAGYDVCGWSEHIHALVCPPSGSKQANAFRSYANLIISQTGDDGLQNDDEALMNASLLLESYFMQIINNQFQCMLVWANACNYIDTTGYQANLYWEGTFRSNIRSEIEAYLKTTEYLALNLLDYRNQSSFDGDFDYMQYGLAPNVHFREMLARSQFLANLLYDGLGVDYPVMCGSVIVPSKYNTAMATPDPSITISINGSPITPTANTMASRYPYTYWSQGENPECAPDNMWRSYRFGKVSENGNGWTSTEYEISLVDDIPAGNNMVMYGQPWSHFATPKGKITALWYNPQNPSETSTTQTDSTFIQFAYFAARWNWGYSLLSMNVKHNKPKENIWQVYHEGAVAPYLIWTYFKEHDNYYDGDGTGASDYGYNAVMTFNYNGNFGKKGLGFIAADWQRVKAKTSANSVNADKVPQLWASNYIDIAAEMNYKEQTYSIAISTSTKKIGGYECPDDNVIYEEHGMSSYANSFFAIQDLKINNEYEFGTQYQIVRGNKVPSNESHLIQLLYKSWMQVVYTGNYPLN